MNRKIAVPKKKISLGSSSSRSVFHDLFDPDETAELTKRALLLRGLQEWFVEAQSRHTAAAKKLGVTQARISEINHGKIGSFSLDLLVRLAARAGLRPELRFAAW